MRKKPRFHSLKKLKVRQDWSRWTLYSIQNLRPPNIAQKTYFQQKFKAKSDTRAYHGEQIREKQWKRMFRRNLPAVVPMDHTYLARHDGSEQASGRGAGADTPDSPRTPPRTPYMQMTYYPIERRLDSAVFRALFASSVRQARQFVVHGLVKVNGKKMVYPGYQLNPGDLFQVEPDSVMFATGAPKKTTNASRRIARKLASERQEAREEADERAAQNAPKPLPKVPLLGETTTIQKSTEPAAPPNPKAIKQSLQSLIEEAKAALEEDVKAKDKQKLRDFRRSVRKTLSLWKHETPENITTLSDQLAFLKSRFSPSSGSSTSATEKAAADSETELTTDQQQELDDAFARLKLEAEDEGDKKNHDKPYKTPWQPRDYMSAFAFIPRYLEVNQKVCAAVYLRHPVARPGLCEVPTPFPYETGQLAFNWYLRRR